MSSLNHSTWDKLLVFGSQSLSFDAAAASELHAKLVAGPHLRWILEALSGLPDTFASVTASGHAPPSFASLQNNVDVIQQWTSAGRILEDALPLRNTILTPLVVATQLAELVEYLDRDQTSFQTGTTQAVGLCTGLLTASAFSCSRSQQELAEYGTVAINLALLVGAFVDLEDAERPSRSLSIGWSTDTKIDSVLSTLDEVQSAYLSVQFDEFRATITVDDSQLAKAKCALKSQGITVQEVGLNGRFHYEPHITSVSTLRDICNGNPKLLLPHATELLMPLRTDACGRIVSHGYLHTLIAEAMLTQAADWYTTFQVIDRDFAPCEQWRVITFGAECRVPQLLSKKLGARLSAASAITPSAQTPNEAIAVVGMSCRFPGAENLEEFWKLLCAGESQHKEVPSDRFKVATYWREPDPKRKWYGNFIDDYDAFDHKFFRKSPREMISTDPQHRLMLEASYQAVEQSGYFNSANKDRHIGCYVGVGLVDYENNIACYPANAYSATGTLKSFTAGKISHYFGWTGPGLTIDTACSSSAVAVHTACKAILNGECNGALAGGVNIMTSPEWFQNLSGASFLSLTGQCKPFDARADGYCRGEGVGAVFLKKLSQAQLDGDPIYGVIAGSAVYQNENCTAITVPNAPSLSDLFRNVCKQATLRPSQVTVIEAHGTGTPVGDPAEYDSITRVFGGSQRRDDLHLGSAKGLVGHLESASGIVAIIKILLMINKRKIPPQASHQSMNPLIKANKEDRILIDTTLRSWDAPFLAALINNYGASGSNASLMITEHRHMSQPCQPLDETDKHPFLLCGSAADRISANANALLSYLDHAPTALRDLSLSISRQANAELEYTVAFSCQSLDDLRQKLKSAGSSTQLTARPRPVILCFGGQVSRCVGLDRQVYQSFPVFKRHIDECDKLCVQLGFASILPGIFSTTPSEDIVQLQTMLFASQYACAKTWLTCGLQVEAVVGLSFGELTALCISGVLSLTDALKMVAGRAELIMSKWGPEKGAMMAVEGDAALVDCLIALSKKRNTPVTIACHIGPRQFTIAGPVSSIAMVAEMTKSDPIFSTLKTKALNVTNAFHCSLSEPILEELRVLGRRLTFKAPVIRFERATESRSDQMLSARFVADHMREPAFYNHAVQRLTKEYPDSIWLEAGSNSTIANVTSRALGDASSKSHFQSVNISGNNSVSHLVDATVSLWKQGVHIRYWGHVESNAALLLLPPYQFERHKHWMNLKEIQPRVTLEKAVANGMYIFEGYSDATNTRGCFKINMAHQKLDRYISNHRVAGSAYLCPSTLQLELVTDALMSLRSDFRDMTRVPQLLGLESHSPMVYDPSRPATLEVESMDDAQTVWHFRLSTVKTLHASGTMAFPARDDEKLSKDFARLERFFTRDRFRRVMEKPDEVIQGRSIYKSFAEYVKYGDMFKGLEKLASRGLESAGRISRRHDNQNWYDTGLLDAFCQVAGIFINCMTDHADGEMFISDFIEYSCRSPSQLQTNTGTWEAYACHDQKDDKQFTSDVFIFDATSGVLVEVILGIHYVRVSRKGLGKMLLRLSGSCPVPDRDDELPRRAPSAVNGTATAHSHFKLVDAPSTTIEQEKPMTNGVNGSHPTQTATTGSNGDGERIKILERIKDIISNLSGIDVPDIKDDAEMADLGIDSLMGMELVREIEAGFKCSLPLDEINDCTTLPQVHACVSKTLGRDVGDSQPNKATSHADAAQHDLVMNGSMADSSPAHGANKTDMLPFETVVEVFRKIKDATDSYVDKSGLKGYSQNVLPRSTELCVVHILDAFDSLGSSIRDARPGDIIEPVEYLPRHQQFMEFVYDLLENLARLVNRLDSGEYERTSIAVPAKKAEVLLQDVVERFPETAYDHRLTYLTGSKLADCLVGKVDALQLIFGSPEGREISAGMYGKSPINTAWIAQMSDLLRDLVCKLPSDTDEPLRILEMGAGTGGTTSRMVPLLDSLGVNVEYTVTDISPSLVAGARKRFKEHTFVKFMTFDIEKQPPKELVESQHMVIATNCVHATHKLVQSTTNIRQILRKDGFLVMLEMTEPLPWVDLIFGLVEGWWLFDDGRTHALVPAEHWRKSLQDAGYGHVDWTEGEQPETAIQRIIIAFADPQTQKYAFHAHPQQTSRGVVLSEADIFVRQQTIDSLVDRFTFDMQSETAPVVQPLEIEDDMMTNRTVLLTGATGSLGAHLVGHLVGLGAVNSVICLNRPSSSIDAFSRQMQSLESKGISLSPGQRAKIKVLVSDTSKAMLGLSQHDYDSLRLVTDVIHNAWPMSITRPVQAFDAQFKTMQGLLQLARAASETHDGRVKVGFQFVSSIATVGFYTLGHPGTVVVPEDSVSAGSVLATGYGDAKLVCEMLLERTLRTQPERYRAMSVRIGQIAGSRTTGYWNPTEHLAFLFKSAQTLRCLPALSGTLSWCPVNDVAGTLSEILLPTQQLTPPLLNEAADEGLGKDSYGVYQIENPDRQPWAEMLSLLSIELGIKQIVPFDEWLTRVKQFPGSVEDNPAARLADFLASHFERMSCGELVLGTEHAREHSQTLRETRRVSPELVRRYIHAWKDTGFLSN